jgi:hypothetical protein
LTRCCVARVLPAAFLKQLNGNVHIFGEIISEYVGKEGLEVFTEVRPFLPLHRIQESPEYSYGMIEVAIMSGVHDPFLQEPGLYRLEKKSRVYTCLALVRSDWDAHWRSNESSLDL